MGSDCEDYLQKPTEESELVLSLIPVDNTASIVLIWYTI